MLYYTRSYIAKLLNINYENFKYYNDKKFLEDFICFQCGSIYKNIDNISECEFCNARKNHINKLYDIL